MASVIHTIQQSRGCAARKLQTRRKPVHSSGFQETFSNFPQKRLKTPSPFQVGGLDALNNGAGSRGSMMQGEDLYQPNGDFWQLELPSADQLTSDPDPVDSVVPRMRRFGSTGGAPVFSKLERQQRDAQARLEREALDQMISEIVIMMTSARWGSGPRDVHTGYFHLQPGDMQRNLAKCAATEEHSNEIERPVAYSCNIAQRSSKDETVRAGVAFEYACRCWRGRVVAEEGLQAHLLSALGAKYVRNPYGSGYLVGNPTGDPGGARWPYCSTDYPWGEGWDLDEEINSMMTAIEMAQFYRRKIVESLKVHETFKKMHDGSCKAFCAHSPDEVSSKMNDEINGVGQHFPDQSEDLRTWILRRYDQSMKAKRIATKIQEMCGDAIQNRRAELEDGSSLLLSVVTTVDILKPIIDDMKPTEASRLYTVLRCARVQDDDMFKLLSTRMPRLHIYTIYEMLPHARRPNGVGILYRDRQIKVPIGMVTSRMRSRIRYENPHINPVGVAEMIEEEHYGTDRDPAYKWNEGRVILLDGDRTDRNNFTPRRVKNYGWNQVDYDLDPDHQLKLECHDKYFTEPPVVTCELVHADTRLGVAPNDPYGGLEPERWLKTIQGKMRYEPSPEGSAYTTSNPNRNPWVRPPEEDTRAHLRCPEGGILGRYNITCLTSEHEGAHFRIKVTMQGKSCRSMGAETLILTAETAPMVLVSNKRASEVKGVKKRKADAPA